MSRYSEAVKTDVRRLMSPPRSATGGRPSGSRGSRERWCRHPRTAPDGWSATDKFTVVLETAGLNARKLGGYCRELGLFPEQVVRWRQAAQESNAQTLLKTADQKDLQKRHQEDQREIKRL